MSSMSLKYLTNKLFGGGGGGGWGEGSQDKNFCLGMRL